MKLDVANGHHVGRPPAPVRRCPSDECQVSAGLAAAQGTGIRAIARQLAMPPSSVHKALQLAG